MKVFRLTLVATAALALAACKGSKGAAGDPGATGTPGPVVPAPQIDFATLPGITHEATLTLVGTHFAATNTSGTATVLVNGSAAEILSQSDTQITFTHGVPADSNLYYTTALVNVQVNNQTSNVVPLTIVPPEQELFLGNAVFRNPGQMTVAGTDILVAGDDVVTRLSATGTVTNPAGLNTAIQKVWLKGTDYWALDENGDLFRINDTGIAQAGSFGSFNDAEWDAAGDLYVLQGADIAKWDHTSHVTTPAWATVTNGGAVIGTFITRIGNLFYVTDASNGAIVSIDITTPATQVVVAANGTVPNARGLANDGTNLITFSNGNLKNVDNAGVVTDKSVLHFGTTNVAGIVLDAAGRIYVSASDRIVRYAANGSTIETWENTPGAYGFGVIGSRIFNGSASVVGAGDLVGGVLYEYMADGSLRRVTGNLENYNYRLANHNGKFYQANRSTGDISTIDPDSGAVVRLYDNVAVPVLDSPLAIDVDATGAIWVTHYDDVSAQEAVAKFTAAGVLVDAAFITSPVTGTLDSIVVQGGRILVEDSDYEQLYTAPITATAGTVLTPFAGQNALYTYPYALYPAANGDVLFVDHYNGNYGDVYEITPSNETKLLMGYVASPLEEITRDANGNYWGFDYYNDDELVLVLP